MRPLKRRFVGLRAETSPCQHGLGFSRTCLNWMARSRHHTPQQRKALFTAQPLVLVDGPPCLLSKARDDTDSTYRRLPFDFCAPGARCRAFAALCRKRAEAYSDTVMYVRPLVKRQKRGADVASHAVEGGFFRRRSFAAAKPQPRRSLPSFSLCQSATARDASQLLIGTVFPLLTALRPLQRASRLSPHRSSFISSPAHTTQHHVSSPWGRHVRRTGC